MRLFNFSSIDMPFGPNGLGVHAYLIYYCALLDLRGMKDTYFRIARYVIYLILSEICYLCTHCHGIVKFIGFKHKYTRMHARTHIYTMSFSYHSLSG
jgi:hypothetical protein